MLFTVPPVGDQAKLKPGVPPESESFTLPFGRPLHFGLVAKVKCVIGGGDEMVKVVLTLQVLASVIVAV